MFRSISLVVIEINSTLPKTDHKVKQTEEVGESTEHRAQST